MKIWVDADACPKVIKEILYRTADRLKIPVILVANSYLKTPKSPYIQFVQVAAGFDVADSRIVQEANPEDLVVTADIPLAAEVIEKGAQALNPRGELYSADTIRQILTMRDFMETMRASGEVSGGPAAMNQRDRRMFADSLDRLLAAQGHKA